jgi:Uncharacterized protein conserved in bacteria
LQKAKQLPNTKLFINNTELIDVLLIIVAVILLLIGILGCVIPALPGPPLCFVGVLLVKFSQWGTDITIMWLAIFLVLTIVVSLIDYYIPIWGVKKFGGGKGGIWGTAIGIVIGLFFLPWGLILGPFIGALLGELIAGKSGSASLKAALGSTLGFLLGTGFKLIVCIWMTVFCVVEIF